MRLPAAVVTGVVAVVAVSSVITGTTLAIADGNETDAPKLKNPTSCVSSDPELAERLASQLDAAVAAKPDGIGFQHQ